MQVNFFTTAANTRTTGSKRLGKFMKPGFYAVLGKRDYWKINDKKVGIWELTEYQPAGWLCSLAIKPEVMPQNCDIIHDRASSIIRLTHNLNSLLTIYHHIKKPETLCLVAGCGKQTNQRAAAKDLYCSQHFQACRNYAQTQGGWQILSPLHRLLEPEKVISPYDKSPYSLFPKERQMWAQQVVDKLIKITNPNVEIVFLTGKVYRQQVIPILQKHGYITRTPMKGLGIGQQIRWLLNQSLAPKQLTLKL